MSDLYVDQQINIRSIRAFLAHRESIFLFLVLTMVAAVLLVVFGQPTSLTNYTTQQTSLSHLGQVTICLISGLGTLILSRVILFFVNRAHEVSPAGLAVWVVVELLVCVSVITLVLWAVSGAGKLDLAPLVGTVVLGFVGLLLVPTAVTYLILRLRETHNELIRVRQVLARQDPASQVPADTNVNFYVKGGKMAFSTKLSNILYIEAADNYVNIHYINGEKEDTFILFNSMKNIEKNFKGTSLMRCHRGYMVNAENVKLMRKDGLGLLLELNQTDKVVPVSKSFAEPITKYFAYNTSMPLPDEQK